jgi:uncharacterized protein (TIGR03545 family)
VSVRLVRWKAVAPLALFIALAAAAWRLWADAALKRLIEVVGTEIVGAKVDVARATVRLLAANVTVEGLAVTNPDAPMSNLFEAEQIVADLRFAPLLEKKAVVETLAVRGVRFGTARRTSGAIELPSPTTGVVARRVLDWNAALPRPALDLDRMVGQVVRTGAISQDSLRTLQRARALAASADSLREALSRRLRELDPSPTLDTARALADRLRSTSVRQLGLAGARDAAGQVRGALTRLAATRDGLRSLQRAADSAVGAGRQGLSALDQARRDDYAYARSLLSLPSLSTPDVSLALFADLARSRATPLLRWANLAQEHLPPGLDPRRRTGPERARRAGATFTFPRRNAWPTFLVELAEASLAIGGGGAAAGSYRAGITGFTTEPAVYGRPLSFAAVRAGGRGPSRLAAFGVVDRVRPIPRDSVRVEADGLALPSISLGALGGAELALGSGRMELLLERTGDSLDARLLLRSADVSWRRREADSSAAAAAPPRAPRIGTREWLEDALWRATSAIREVEIAVRMAGPLRSPRLSVSSNVGEAVAGTLQRALGEQVRRAEAEARAEVDRLVQVQVDQARARVSALEREARDRVGAEEARLEAVRTELEQRLRELTEVVPGVRLPGVRPPGGNPAR